ncbi:unnamed protein product [Candidula unifasciata]|uniref:L-Fucosyltransferase n=1 Tax=Candidula unifasciata TaxID=100452 RepID=A0A8S3YMR5_9EUPU|nr:unnamed protein product [Candidula unifasciata]
MSIASNTTGSDIGRDRHSDQSNASTCVGNMSYYQLYGKKPHVNNVTLYVVANKDLSGRLGNHMFKYASLLGIARAQGRGLSFHPESVLAKTFKITNIGVIESSKRQVWPVIYEVDIFDDKMFKLPMYSVRISGYLQSFWYFFLVSDEVRQEFTFHDSIANAAANILHDVGEKYNSTMTVGVHVRRTDFLTTKLQRLGYAAPEKSYFMKAFSLMKSKFPGRKISFLVASDDLPWCEENLSGNDIFIIPEASPAVHMATLSSCDHVIISGGSYGWWSGWLANGYVIYFTRYMRSGTPFGDWYVKEQYYPRMWIGLGN